LERGRAVGHAVPDVVQTLALRVEILRDRRVVARGREQLDVRVGDLEQRLLDAVALDDLAVLDLAAERVVVVRDRSLEIAHRDRDMVDPGEQRRRHEASSNRRNNVIWSMCFARSSGSVTPSPSSGERHSTPSLPSLSLRCTACAASAVWSSVYTFDSVGWM